MLFPLVSPSAFPTDFFHPVSLDAALHRRKTERVRRALRRWLSGERVAVDVSDFRGVVSVDAEWMLGSAEPGATFEDLVAAMLPHGVLPIVVPNRRDATIAEALAHGELPSAAGRSGHFGDTCTRFEVIDLDGAVTKRRADQGLPTAGFVSKVTFRLREAAPGETMDTLFRGPQGGGLVGRARRVWLNLRAALPRRPAAPPFDTSAVYALLRR